MLAGEPPEGPIPILFSPALVAELKEWSEAVQIRIVRIGEDYVMESRRVGE